MPNVIAPVTAPASSIETIEYISGLTGASFTFGDPSTPNILLTKMQGIGLSPVDNFVVDTAYQPGAQFVRTKKKTSPITLGLTIYGDPNSLDYRASLWNTVDAMLAVLEPSISTPGTLVKTDTQGNSRQLNNVQYVGGFEVADQAANRAYVQVELVFEAYDPTWYSTQQHSAWLGTGSDTFGFAVPLNLTLGSLPNKYFTIGNPASGSLVVTNAGNIYTNPVFTFYGPCTNYQIRNATTNQSFLVTQQLYAGDYLVVDTNAGTCVYYPSKGGATPVYNAFAGNRDWVKLAPGTNTLSFTRDAAANQQCQVAWSDGWNHG